MTKPGYQKHGPSVYRVLPCVSASGSPPTKETSHSNQQQGPRVRTRGTENTPRLIAARVRASVSVGHGGVLRGDGLHFGAERRGGSRHRTVRFN